MTAGDAAPPAARAVLIVEDVAEMRELLREMVDGMPGFRVSACVADAWQARQECLRRRPDVVLLDEILPGESGLDLLTELQKDAIHVLLVTGLENPTHAIAPGVLGRLRKPTWKTLAADRARFAAVLGKIPVTTASP